MWPLLCHASGPESQLCVQHGTHWSFGDCTAIFQNFRCWQEGNATCISSEAGLITHHGVLVRMQIMQTVQNLTSKQAISGMAPALSVPQVAQRQQVSTTTRAAKNPFKAPFKGKVCI